MLVIVNTRLPQSVGLADVSDTTVVTLDARVVFLVGPLGQAGKVHWARREVNGEPRPRCGRNFGRATSWMGKVTEVTCAKCQTDWWYAERLLAPGVFEDVQ